MANIHEDRARAYMIIDQHALRGFSRLVAIKLFDSLRHAKRRMKGRKLYAYVMVTIKEIRYRHLSREVVDGLVHLVIPHFKSMHERFKGKV